MVYTALNDPTQYSINANQKNVNRLVCREYAYINRLKTTYVRYRKRLHTLFLYISKRRFHRPSFLALLLLLLLLCGDVEVNPGSTTSKERQANKELDAGLIQDTSKEQQKREDSYKQLISIESEQSMQSYCISIGSPLPIEIEQQYTTDIDIHRQAKKRLLINEIEKREQQLSKKRTLSGARFTAEKSVQRQQRLLRSRVNQARRLKEEDETAREARLEILKFSARQRLQKEDDNARQTRLEVLKCYASHRLNKENETARQARLQVLKCNASQRLKKEDETARQERLEAIRRNYRERW